MRFHALKMHEINTIIKELWTTTYKGNGFMSRFIVIYSSLTVCRYRHNRDSIGSRRFQRRCSYNSKDIQLSRLCEVTKLFWIVVGQYLIGCHDEGRYWAGYARKMQCWSKSLLRIYHDADSVDLHTFTFSRSLLQLSYDLPLRKLSVWVVG